MFIYLLILLVISFLYFQKNLTFEKNKGGYYFFMILFMLIVGFRDMIGGFDVYIYGEIYESPLDYMLTYDLFEPGFLRYYQGLRLFSEDRYFMFFMSAIIITGLHFRHIKKVSPIVIFSLFIYFAKLFLMSFVYLRQFLAMGIIWFAIPYLIDKKYWKSLIFVVCAYYFHHSSLVFVPLLFIAHYKFSKTQLVWIILTFMVVFFSPIGSVFVSSLADDSGNEKLQMYAQKASVFNVFYFIEASILMIIGYYFRDHFYKYKRLIPIYNGMLCYILFSIIGIINPTFVRLSWYYLIFLTFFIPYVYLFIKDASKKNLFKTSVYIYFTALFLRLLVLYDGGDFMPYKAFFQDFERNGMWEFMEYRGIR